MKRTELGKFRTFVYHLPFNYGNVKVVRRYNQGETHGMEMNPINSYWPDPERRVADYIEVTEEIAISKVEVIGSACTPPGYVMLSAEPINTFRRSDEIADIMPVRFRVNNLWGMHLRVDQWAVKDTEVSRFTGKPSYQSLPEDFTSKNPGMKDYSVKLDSRDLPLTGMSCAVFSIPLSKKIKITAGSEMLGWTDDNFPDDAHYSIRIIRVIVCDILE